eukprot:971678-Amphidinium_carterae.1
MALAQLITSKMKALDSRTILLERLVTLVARDPFRKATAQAMQVCGLTFSMFGYASVEEYREGSAGGNLRVLPEADRPLMTQKGIEHRRMMT